MSAPNSTLSDSDIETLNSIGHDTVENIVALVVESVLYTIYFVLVVFAGRILLNSKSRTKISIGIFGVVLTMLLLDTAMCIIDVNNAIREITFTLYATASGTLADRYNNLVLPWPVENALYAFMSNLGDVVIIWRTWAFYRDPRERWVLLLPISLLVGSFTTSCLIAYCVAKLDADPELGDFVNPPFCVNMQIASYSMALATTAVATAMICWKTWIYRRTIGTTIRSNNRKTRVEKIMTILIESGVIYFFFFLSAVVDDAGNVPNLEESTLQLQFASTVWTYMTSHILGIYPVIVVILVHSQRSYIESVTTTTAASSTLPSRYSHSHSGSHSTPAHKPWIGTSTVSSTGSHAKPAPFVPGRDHFLDIDVHELRQVHADPSIDDVNGQTSGAGEESELQSVKLPEKVGDPVAV
ncbi:unnamed protein product [Peniophora sp. CBMAI 1063]|nr:unnamed protein product [Peniophora sp. CBMAI 1063]